MARNFEFFGAPVGMFFVIDERMGWGQWAHLGMFMQSVALAATAHGVDSCFQEAWARVRVTLRDHFGLGPTELVYCGMALGYADPAHTDELAALAARRGGRLHDLQGLLSTRHRQGPSAVRSTSAIPPTA